MTTKRHTITGILQWCKVFEENRELKDYLGNPHDFGGLYKLKVFVDKDNKAIYKASGTSGRIKVDEDGNTFVNFKRKHKDRFDWAGGAPKVFKADGSEWSLEHDGVIPNGSEGTVEFTVYTTSMSPGTRLESVTVNKVAEMPKKESEDVTVVIEPPKAKCKYDDEIPF